MTRRAALLGMVALGAGYAGWRLPATQRFVATVRASAREREAELRQAVEVAVRADATARAPRHAPETVVPDLDVAAAWGARALDESDDGRSLSPDDARALLRDPAGRAASTPDARAL